MTRGGPLALAGCLLLAACQFAPPEEIISVASLPRAPVKHGPFEITITEIGVVKATSSRGISAPFWGTKASKLVPEGTLVEAGQPVAWLDAVQTKEEAETKAVELKGLDSALAKSKEELDHQRQISGFDARDARAKLASGVEREVRAQDEVERLRPLAESGALSAEEMRTREQAHLEAVHAREQLELAARRAEVDAKGGAGDQIAAYDDARARHATLSRDVEQLQQNIERLVVKAPIGGVVTYPEVALRMTSKEKRKVKVGDEVVPWRPFVEIADLARVEVRSQVPERRVGEVHAGTAVRVRVDASGDRRLSGKVIRVESLAVTRADAQATSFVAALETRAEKVFEISIELDGGAGNLKPGMTVTADLVVSRLPPATYAPLQAIFDDGDTKVAFVVDGSRVERRAVTLGASRQDAVVVTDGLSAGEMVLLRDPRGTGKAS